MDHGDNCPACGCNASMAGWATVVIDPESMNPVEASDVMLEELAELDISVDRLWIAPGPPDAEWLT